MTAAARTPGRIRSGLALLALALLALAACETAPTEPPPPAGTDWGVVVNSVERSLTVFETEDPAHTITIGLGAEGTPTASAVRGALAVVPMGTAPEAVVVDLRAGEILHRVALPELSGATGAGFLNDSIAIVGNPELNTVSPVNVLRGTVGEEIEVGLYPSAVIEADGAVLVVNAGLENWAPTEPGTLSRIGADLTVERTIQLSGLNPGAATWHEGTLYILNAGAWGAGTGSLSVMSGTSWQETAHLEGFGDFPGSLAPGPDGNLHIGLYGEGVMVWDPSAAAFLHGPSAPLTPADTPPVSDIASGPDGSLYIANPGTCEDPGVVYRLGEAGEVAGEIPVGVCPSAISFTTIED